MTRSRRKPTTPARPTNADQDRAVAADSLIWSKRNALIAASGVAVAIAIAAVPIVVSAVHGAAERQPSGGMAVATVPQDPIGGARILPVAGGRQPTAYLGTGWVLRIDCLQRVEPSYLIARISDGPYKGQWIDSFDIRTPRGEDVRFLNPPLPECGPPVGPEPTASVTAGYGG